MAGVEYEHFREFVRGCEKDDNALRKHPLAEMQRAGVEPSCSQPTLLRIHDNLFCPTVHHGISIRC